MVWSGCQFSSELKNERKSGLKIGQINTSKYLLNGLVFDHDFKDSNDLHICLNNICFWTFVLNHFRTEQWAVPKCRVNPRIGGMTVAHHYDSL